jgi:hypothetical protein
MTLIEAIKVTIEQAQKHIAQGAPSGSDDYTEAVDDALGVLDTLADQAGALVAQIEAEPDLPPGPIRVTAVVQLPGDLTIETLDSVMETLTGSGRPRLDLDVREIVVEFTFDDPSKLPPAGPAELSVLAAADAAGYRPSWDDTQLLTNALNTLREVDDELRVHGLALVYEDPNLGRRTRGS